MSSVGFWPPPSSGVYGFELLSRLAVGGIAEIFLAREEMAPPGEFFVVKRLLPHVSRQPDTVEMFLDEARVAARLDHPHIVRIHSVGSVRDQFFLTMEYLRGLDAARICGRFRRARRELPLDFSVYVLVSTLSALDYAHTRTGIDGRPLAIVHRDVTPQNIFVTFDGGLKLLDFGVAKAANALHRTRTGAVLGKVGYMSPEQYRLGIVDHRSDLFNLGAVMFEMTVGRRLYDSRKLGEFEVFRQTCEQPPPRPSSMRSGYPKVLERVLMGALAKRPEDRIQNAAEFRAELIAAANQLGLNFSPASLTSFMRREFSADLARLEERLEYLASVPPGEQSLSWDSLGPLPLDGPPSNDSLPRITSSALSEVAPAPRRHSRHESAPGGVVGKPRRPRPRRTSDLRRERVQWRRPTSTLPPSTLPPSGIPSPATSGQERNRPQRLVLACAGVLAAVIALVVWLW